VKKPSEHIIHSLNLIKGNKRIKNKLLVVEVEKHLVELFGDVVQQYLTRLHITGETLHLYVNSSTLQHDLYHGKQKLMDHLHERIGNVVFKDVQVHG
jgi:hypothetical protein